jgi:hypothetical protein
MTKKIRATQNDFNTKLTEAAAAATKQASRGCLVGVALYLCALALVVSSVL